MSFGTLLRKNRDRCKLTGAEIADLLGISQGTYHNWESNKTSLPAKYLPQLAEIFKVEIIELIPNYNGKVVKIVNNQTPQNQDNIVIDFEVGIEVQVLYEKLLATKDALIANKEEVITLQREEIKRLKVQSK